MNTRRDRPRIYTIGPFRAATELKRRANIAGAEAAAIDLARHGAFYRCPHLHSAHFEGEGDDAYWLALGFDLLSECDAAYLVPDAPDAPRCEGGDGPQRVYLLPTMALHGERYASHGSIAEVAWCEEHGLPVLASICEVQSFIRRWRSGRERDPDCPCEAFYEGVPSGDCEGDGHYRCAECANRCERVEGEGEGEHRCDYDNCEPCSARDCPYGDPLHRDKDGCPSCDVGWNEASDEGEGVRYSYGPDGKE